MSEDCPHCIFEKTEANCRGCFEGSHYRPKPITNADRIRAMTDEELAKFIFDYVACDDCQVGSKKCKREFAKCKDAALCWLKQEVTE